MRILVILAYMAITIKEFVQTKILKQPAEDRNFYQIIGEEQGVYQLVKNFYRIMESDSFAKDCLDTHKLINGEVEDEVKKKFFMFLCGWFGGPQLFVEAYGHPRMKARHNHVSIRTEEKEQWIYCMNLALEQHLVGGSMKLSKREKREYLNSFAVLANRIQNR